MSITHADILNSIKALSILLDDDPDPRQVGLFYAKALIGRPYVWAGDDPMKGFDCSGLALEFLQAAGLEAHGIDSTAHDLYLEYKLRLSDPAPGCLVFWFKDGRAIHTEIMISSTHSIGASGGGSATKTLEDAIKHNAFVKPRPITYRGNYFKIVDPFKEL